MGKGNVCWKLQAITRKHTGCVSVRRSAIQIL
jgi:hypothetical protein